MADLVLKYICEICEGSGEVTTGHPQQTEVQCTNCNGDGVVEQGVLEGSGDAIDAIADVFPNDQKQQLRDKLNDIEDKIDEILEKIEDD